MPDYDQLVAHPDTSRRFRNFKRFLSYRDEYDYSQDETLRELLDAAAETTGWDG